MRRFAFLAAALLAASPAFAFLSSNSLVVRPEPSGSFVVLPGGRGMSEREAWCAAGDYAVRALNVPPTERIWRLSPPPRRGGEGVRFSLSPEGAAARTGLWPRGDDGSLSVAFAEALCWEPAPGR